MTMVALRAAVLCETVLTEADGLRSPIRIFSRLTLAPGEAVDATLLVMLANTEAQTSTSHVIVLRIEDAGGMGLGQQVFEVTSPLETGGTFDLVVPFRVGAPSHSALRWLRLLLDDQELTRVPLRLDVTS
jgi:hypothetical protein